MQRFQVVALMPGDNGYAPSECLILPTEQTLPEGGISLAHHLLSVEADMVANLYAQGISRISPGGGLSAYSLARLMGIAAHHAVFRLPLNERRADLRSHGFDPSGSEGTVYNNLFTQMQKSLPKAGER